MTLARGALLGLDSAEPSPILTATAEENRFGPRVQMMTRLVPMPESQPARIPCRGRNQSEIRYRRNFFSGLIRMRAFYH